MQFFTTSPVTASATRCAPASDSRGHPSTARSAHPRAADIVIAKTGYGIVAAPLSHRLPILYADHGEFAEYPLLVQALDECPMAAFILQVDLTGAQVAADKALDLLDRTNSDG